MLAMLAVTILAITAWPVPAVVLDFFEVIASPDEVLLEWSTLAEFNIEGFNIYCKEAAEPPAAYHIIGTEVAQGSTDVGYFYSFAVTQLEPGVAYCFRIEEVTTDGTAPEQFDRCGFGLNITPTPTPVILPGAGVVGQFTCRRRLWNPSTRRAAYRRSMPRPHRRPLTRSRPNRRPHPLPAALWAMPRLPSPPDANAAANARNNPVGHRQCGAEPAWMPHPARTMITPDGSGAQSQNAAPPGADTALAQGAAHAALHRLDRDADVTRGRGGGRCPHTHTAADGHAGQCDAAGGAARRQCGEHSARHALSGLRRRERPGYPGHHQPRPLPAPRSDKPARPLLRRVVGIAPSDATSVN
ncbi:MAG: hypothetical protein R2838_01175 [Caldilineaceae bacterium]